MTKTLLIIVGVMTLINCAQEPIKESANVKSHLRVNKSLDECQRLGQVITKYEMNKKLSPLDNKIQAQEKMKQQAFDDYRANNIVFLSTRLVEGGYREPDTIAGKGLAYMCY